MALGPPSQLSISRPQGILLHLPVIPGPPALIVTGCVSALELCFEGVAAAILTKTWLSRSGNTALLARRSWQRPVQLRLPLSAAARPGEESFSALWSADFTTTGQLPRMVAEVEQEALEAGAYVLGLRRCGEESRGNLPPFHPSTLPPFHPSTLPPPKFFFLVTVQT